jgi:hypothetical protein
LGIPVSVSHFETPYYSGFYQIGNLLLSVTNGLGLTIAPIRYQAPAEVTLLILRSSYSLRGVFLPKQSADFKAIASQRSNRNDSYELTLNEHINQTQKILGVFRWGSKRF